LQNVLNFLQNIKDDMLDSIEVQKDKNLELDPYFYERKKELHKIREEIQSGKMEMLSSEEWDLEMQKLDKELDLLDANK
jgi:hypothetical protein